MSGRTVASGGPRSQLAWLDELSPVAHTHTQAREPATTSAERPEPEWPRHGFIRDVRPDLAADSRWWTWLLTHAYVDTGDESEGAYSKLVLVRAAGGRLVQTDKGGYRIVPQLPVTALGEEGYEGGQPGWERDRAAYLVPHAAEIAGWLRQLAACEQETSERQKGDDEDERFLREISKMSDPRTGDQR